MKIRMYAVEPGLKNGAAEPFWSKLRTDMDHGPPRISEGGRVKDASASCYIDRPILMKGADST